MLQLLEDPKKKQKYLVFSVCLALSLVGVNLLMQINKETPSEIILKEEAKGTTTSSKKADTVTGKADTVEIYLSGAVLNPGLYLVDKGSRVGDVLDRMGCLTADADLTRVNLAKQCRDGMHINVPYSKLGKKATSTSNSSSKKSPKEQVAREININTATAEELCKLNGVGPQLAQAIIDYREKNGMFKNRQELLKVRGIGNAKLAKFESEITW